MWQLRIRRPNTNFPAGVHHTCAIATDNTLWCWGRNNQGQLGLNKMGDPVPEPTMVSLSDDWDLVHAGGFHTCATKDDDTLWCWGWNTTGQTGVDPLTTQNVLLPTKVSNKTDWNSVRLGQAHTCANDDNLTLYCWGSNANGQLV